VPTLVLSGTADPITPVSFGREMVRRLGRSARHLVVPGGGHGLANPSPCARAATLAFLTDPRLDAVPSACPQP
jgi:pimeloyl-ACP methyl ester carboxylesterase